MQAKCHPDRPSIAKDLCGACYNRQWRATHPESTKIHNKKLIVGRHGISLYEHEILMLTQGGSCAICDEVSETLCVDHDHQTGRIRGLLCHYCNRGIGLLGDNPERLRTAAEYIK